MYNKTHSISWVIFFVGPDDAQQKIEPHHTAVLGEGDSVQVENKVSIKNGVIFLNYTSTSLQVNA